jgi:hypothetical protein
MPRFDEQYHFQVRLTREEFEKVQERYDAGDELIVVATVILGRGGYSRPCPGRTNRRDKQHHACVGNGSMPLELRNMGEKGKPKREVRDQPCCRACRR